MAANTNAATPESSSTITTTNTTVIAKPVNICVAKHAEIMKLSVLEAMNGLKSMDTTTEELANIAAWYPKAEESKKVDVATSWHDTVKAFREYSKTRYTQKLNELLEYPMENVMRILGPTESIQSLSQMAQDMDKYHDTISYGASNAFIRIVDAAIERVNKVLVAEECAKMVTWAKALPDGDDRDWNIIQICDTYYSTRSGPMTPVQTRIMNLTSQHLILTGLMLSVRKVLTNRAQPAVAADATTEAKTKTTTKSSSLSKKVRKQRKKSSTASLATAINPSIAASAKRRSTLRKKSKTS